MQDKLQIWKQESPIKIVGNLSGMKIMSGYMSDSDVLVNATSNHIYIDTGKFEGDFKLSNKIEGIVRKNYLDDTQKKAESFFKREMKDKSKMRRTTYVCLPFTY